MNEQEAPSGRVPSSLVASGAADPELGALAWLLLDARTPAVVVGAPGSGRDDVADALAELLPPDARRVRVAPDDDFAWLPEAVELGWRRERRATGDGPGAPDRRVSPTDVVLEARDLAEPGGIDGDRARIVVRALALGYGLLATMPGAGLEDALNTLAGLGIGTDADERSRIGLVLALEEDARTTRIGAAHYVRPVALDTHGHVQRPGPAVLATWNPAGRFDHFAWGVLPDLAGRLGLRPIDLEREQARRAALLAEAIVAG